MNSNTTRTWHSALAVAGCALLLAAMYASEIAQSGISEIIVEVSKSAGILTLKLETIVYKPASDGSFSLAVPSHGKARGKAAFQARARYNEQAAVLAVHGRVVAIPMWQGFAKFGGAYIGSGCSVEANGTTQTEDVVTTLDYMTAQPYVDHNRIAAMGQSHGGLTTLVFSIIAYLGVRRLVNFVDGLRNNTCVDWEGNLVRAFETYGRQPRYPSFWLYGDNDNYWSKPTPDRMLTACTSAGGKGRLVDFGTFKSDSYGTFASHAGLGIWLPQADAFPREPGLPVGPVQTVAPGSNVEASGVDDPKSDTNKDSE